MQEFRLPDLGEGMQEDEVRRWLVKPGDTIKLDQPMVEVETDKAVVEIPSPIMGRISDIRVAEGQVAKLGEVLAIFDSVTASNSGSAAASAPAGNGAQARQAQADTKKPASAANGQTATTGGRVLAAP